MIRGQGASHRQRRPRGNSAGLHRKLNWHSNTVQLRAERERQRGKEDGEKENEREKGWSLCLMPSGLSHWSRTWYWQLEEKWKRNKGWAERWREKRIKKHLNFGRSLSSFSSDGSGHKECPPFGQCTEKRKGRVYFKGEVCHFYSVKVHKIYIQELYDRCSLIKKKAAHF